MVGQRPWGLCSVCGHKRTLRWNGTVRIHRSEDDMSVCSGSLKPPKQEGQ